MVAAVFPGTFDPVTLGHVDIATRAAAVFDKLTVAVYEQPAKVTLFSPQERVQLWRDAIKHIPKVEVVPFSSLVVELARKIGATVIVRGLRRVADFEYEFEMAFMNKNLAPEIEVVCMFSSRQYQYVSSSLLKEAALLGGDVKSMVPANVAKALRPKIAEVSKKSS